MAFGTIVPIDKALPKPEIENILVQSEATAILFAEKYVGIMKEIKEEVNTLELLICLDEVSDSEIKSFDSLIKLGNSYLEKNDKEFIESDINNEEMNMLLFTSRNYLKFKSSNAFTF